MTTESMDNIMRDENGQPVNVPGTEKPNLVLDANGQPVVPAGTEAPMNQAPKDTLPRPPQPTQMPNQQVPAQNQATTNSNAVEATTTFDELAAKKGFKSAEDLAKAYINLESQNKRVEVTLADAMKARENTQQPQPQATETIVDTEDIDKQDAIKIVESMIDKKLNVVKDAMDYERHLANNPGDAKFASAAIEIVKDNPGIKWGIAFAAAKASNADQTAAQAKEDGRNEAYANINVKQNAQVPQGNSINTQRGNVSVQEVIQGIKTGQIRLSEAKNIINSLNQDLR